MSTSVPLSLLEATTSPSDRGAALRLDTEPDYEVPKRLGGMITESEVRVRIRTHIVENLLYARPDFAFSDEDGLLDKGIFDSLGIMEIIGFVEDTWGLDVPAEGITETNFGTVAAIAQYVVCLAVFVT